MYVVLSFWMILDHLDILGYFAAAACRLTDSTDYSPLKLIYLSPATHSLFQRVTLTPSNIPSFTRRQTRSKDLKPLNCTTKTSPPPPSLPFHLHTSPDRPSFLSTPTPSAILHPFIFYSITTFSPFMLGPCNVQARYERAYDAFLLTFIHFIYSLSFSA